MSSIYHPSHFKYQTYYEVIKYYNRCSFQIYFMQVVLACSTAAPIVSLKITHKKKNEISKQKWHYIKKRKHTSDNNKLRYYTLGINSNPLHPRAMYIEVAAKPILLRILHLKGS